MATPFQRLQRAAISTSGSGDKTIITAVADASFLILGMELIVDGASTVTVKSGSTSLSGAMALGANGGKVLPLSEIGWYQGAKNEAFILNAGSAVAMTGSVVYLEIPHQ